MPLIPLYLNGLEWLIGREGKVKYSYSIAHVEASDVIKKLVTSSMSEGVRKTQVAVLVDHLDFGSFVWEYFKE